MSDATIQTTLPDGVSYVTSADDKISFVADTGTVTWSLRKVEAGSTKIATFTVSVTPTAADVDKLLVLANDSIATATDANSGVAIQAQDKKITTNLSSDPGADDDGVVVN